MAERPPVEEPRPRSADVAHDEPQRAPDREVRAPSRPEEVVSGVDLELARDRTVDDHEDGGATGGGAGPVVAPLRVTDALDRRHDEGHVLGLTAGHDRVDRDFLGRDRHGPVDDEGDLLLRLEAGGVEHRAHPVRRWRDDRQTVGPPLLEAELDRVGDIRDLVPLGRECGRHQYS